MKNKIISIFIICIFLFTSLMSVNAIAPTPRIDLDEYQIIAKDVNSVYVTGTLSLCVGQNIGIYDSKGRIMYNYIVTKNTNSSDSFKVQVPARYLNAGTNTFKVKSTPIKGIINASNPKTLTVTVGSSQNTQTITASNLTLKVGEKKNINASVTSGLPLTFISENASIATVDSNGNVIGRNVGTTKVIISQSGNSQYKPVNKTVTINVTGSSTTGNKAQSISSIDSYQFNNINKSKSIGAKASSGLKVTYKSSNPKIIAVDSNGKMTAKNPGTVKIQVSQSGNNNYKAVTKSITVKVPKLQSRQDAIKPWFDAMQAQRKASWNSYYKWTRPTINNSKVKGTCITFPSVSAQRAGLIKSKYDLGASDGANGSRKSDVKKAIKSINSRYWTYWWKPGGTTKQLVKKGKILPGDVLGCSKHSYVYVGKSKTGALLYNHSGKVCGITKGKGSNRATWFKRSKWNDKQKVWLIARINTFDVLTSCENGSITMSNKYMAAQTIKVTYSPASGKKLKSVKVDGNAIDINKYKTSYTFTKLDRNHTIEVIYN